MSSGRKTVLAVGFGLASAMVILGSVLISAAESRLPGQPTPVPLLPEVRDPPCEPPQGWIYYRLEAGETLASLAEQYGIPPADIQTANCLSAGSPETEGLYLPPAPPPATAPECGPPPGWVLMQIGPDDSVTRLARQIGVSPEALRLANCFDESTEALAGNRVYVPATPTPLQPTATATPPSPTASPAASGTPEAP